MPPTGSPPTPSPSVDDVFASLGCFHVDAYDFIHEGIHAAADRIHGTDPKASSIGKRHVTGRQLCETLRDLAIRRWGLLASLVLRQWGIHTTHDFGRIVFAFVDAGHWAKQPTDSIDDFNNIYNFRDAFDREYKIILPEKIGRA